MAGGISIHVYDVSRGVPAAGLRVELRGPDGKLLVDGQTAKPGTLEVPTPLAGTYEAIFHIGDWLLAVAALLTLWSGFAYLRAAWPVLRAGEGIAVDTSAPDGKIPPPTRE